MSCIFYDKPEECSMCLEARKLQCMLNKQHLKIKKQARQELFTLITENMDSPSRYKAKSGQLGRKSKVEW